MPRSLLLVALLTLSALPCRAAEDAPFRRIAIPVREHGYNHMGTTVITREVEYEAALTNIEKQKGWNNRAAFLKALKEAKIDFDTEALVLLRHTEGSGSVRVAFAPPELDGKTLVCRITREEPETGTADMAYYAFALAVRKDKVDAVVFKSRGREVKVRLNRE